MSETNGKKPTKLAAARAAAMDEVDALVKKHGVEAMSETKATSIPTAQELDEWDESLKCGYATLGMRERVFEGYRRLLVVAEKVEPLLGVSELTEKGWLVVGDVDTACGYLDELDKALKALRAPVEEAK